MNSSNKHNTKTGAARTFSCPKGFIPDRQITDGDLQALADGELSPEDKRSLMSFVMKSPALLGRLDEIISQKNLIRKAWNPAQDFTEH